jgi:undecaprenyl-phosphate 4-deoxy-4-formamido-L-arabinose transferase
VLASPHLSVIIPVLNEEHTIAALYARLVPVMNQVIGGAEVIIIDDGSSDRSLEILRGVASNDPRVKVLSFNRNYGQRAAVYAGLEASRGRVVVTIDGDLQNPPEEIPKLVEKIHEGFDVVGGWRQRRRDSVFRRGASWQFNVFMRRIVTGVDFHDIGCMLRAYSRPVVDSMLQCKERNPYIPALACQFSRRIAEVPVDHAERTMGKSKYGLISLVALQLDLVASFTSAPLKLASIVGLVVALVSMVFGLFLGVRRLIHGPEAEGVFTLFAVLFFLVGGNFLALGLLGEYIGRVYVEVRQRPRSVVAETINFGSVAAGSDAGAARR